MTMWYIKECPTKKDFDRVKKATAINKAKFEKKLAYYKAMAEQENKGGK